MDSDISQKHERVVQDISKRLKVFYEAAVPVKFFHGSTNSTRSPSFDPNKTIDISALRNIVEINADQRYAVVEPNVPMDKLVEATLEHGFIPPVVMEFPGITVGGGIQGAAGESSSFREGLFHQTCLSYEMLLGNGEKMSVSPDEHSELFWNTACSYGTLGLITLAKLRLIPATSYVELIYKRVTSPEALIDTVRRATTTDADFVDAILFSQNLGVVMIGKRTNEKKHGLRRFSRARDEWFYLHAKKVAMRNEKYEETIPLKDYLFRYDRGGFWVGTCGFKRGNLPFNRLTRFIFDAFLKTRELYDILHATNVSQEFVVQDISLPEAHVTEFLKSINEFLGIYPIWICPLKREVETRFSPAFIDTPLVINVGIYGSLSNGKRDYETLLETNRKLETLTATVHGRKVLYAHTYYSESEFWNIYGHEWYERMRAQYKAERFPNIYQKVFVADKYRAGIRRGLFNLARKKLKV